MAVTIEAPGRRWVRVEVEVPGTPEQVWEAVATGPGVSSWFMPTEINAETGESVTRFGPGMDSLAKLSVWDPPRRYLAISRDLGEGAPEMENEWTVEPLGGGRCRVRVQHNLVSQSAEWDAMLGAVEVGWPGWFEILRAYLGHFRGAACSSFQVVATPLGDEAEVWTGLKAALLAAGTPAHSGTVEWANAGPTHNGLLLRLKEPGAGLLMASSCGMGPQVMLMLSVYLYGDGAAATAASLEPQLAAWMAARYPAQG